MHGNAGLVGDREMSITRIFDAPPERVYAAWTSPEAIGRWWGPRGFTTTTETMDVRKGGVWKHIMHGPDGTDYPNEIRYEEVVESTRLVYTNRGGTEDDGGNSMRVTVEFREKNGKTEVSMRMVFPSATERDHVVKEYGALDGMTETMDRLDETLHQTTARQREERNSR